jgi:hypothetical protein
MAFCHGIREMNDKEKLQIIQSVLNDVAGREGCYPDGDIADGIIESIRNLTGDDTFCRGKIRSLDNIKNTFEIHIETWENDADDYDTIVHTGLSSEDVRFYHDLAKLFRSCNASPAGGLGNDEHDLDFLLELVEGVVARHPDLSVNTGIIWYERLESIANYERLCAYVLSEPVEYDFGFCRVFDSFKVFAVQDGKRVDVTAGF